MEERRKQRRHRADRAAKLLVGRSTLADCIAVDINARGAGLSAPEVSRLCENLELTLDGGRTYRPGRIVWRARSRAGMIFDD